MSHSRRKTFYFLLEGLSAFACAYYFNYLFFLLRDRFGFGDRDNLLVGALHGLVYVSTAWYAGRFAQRRGYFTALRLGFGGMAFALVLGGFLPSALGQLAVFACWTLAMCFTWAPLQALVSEGESPERLPWMIGFYNVVWAGTSALAYFCGGAVFERLGVASLYWLPALIHLAQVGVVQWLAGEAGSPGLAAAPTPLAALHTPEPVAFAQPVRPQTFLRMAWLANPFAYIAINTVLATIPGLARRFDLTTTETGLFCSIWLFARLGTFVLLWQWTGWHYRFRWLLAAFVALIASFAAMLLGGTLWLVGLAQVAFGLAVGLIYYSSLFYSMDVGETKGEHGGLHEAAIGAGICVGPAIGAGTLHLLPQYPSSGAIAVSVALVAGLVWLLALRFRRAR